MQVDRAGMAPFAVEGYEIKPAAEFAVEARVLSTEKYHMGREAELSPRRMSDSAVLDHLQISQGNRFYFYRWSVAPPIPSAEIAEHSANMHMIPASDGVRKRLDRVRVGQVVALSGYLVRVRAPDGWHWNGSLTRSDRERSLRARVGAGRLGSLTVVLFVLIIAVRSPLAPSCPGPATPNYRQRVSSNRLPDPGEAGGPMT